MTKSTKKKRQCISSAKMNTYTFLFQILTAFIITQINIEIN